MIFGDLGVIFDFTLPKTNISAPEHRPSQKRKSSSYPGVSGAKVFVSERATKEMVIYGDRVT